jgi:flagellar P-ring protein precursor FlgI
MKAKSGKVFRQAAILAVCILPLWSQPVLAERIKDLASIQGVRSNQLLGYGIVVGLDNTGDQTTQTRSPPGHRQHAVADGREPDG